MPAAGETDEGQEIIVQLANHREIWTRDTDAVGRPTWRSNGEARRELGDQDVDQVVRWAWTTQRRRA